MTPEEQRIAIAQACGWFVGGVTRASDFPDYLNDLNAMHEAIKTLTEKQLETFVLRLCAGDKWMLYHMNICDAIFVAKASASKYAEAFLKTLNLWEDQ